MGGEFRPFTPYRVGPVPNFLPLALTKTIQKSREFEISFIWSAESFQLRNSLPCRRFLTPKKMESCGQMLSSRIHTLWVLIRVLVSHPCMFLCATDTIVRVLYSPHKNWPHFLEGPRIVATVRVILFSFEPWVYLWFSNGKTNELRWLPQFPSAQLLYSGICKPCVSSNRAHKRRIPFLHSLSSRSSTKLFTFHLEEDYVKNRAFDIPLIWNNWMFQ